MHHSRCPTCLAAAAEGDAGPSRSSTRTLFEARPAVEEGTLQPKTFRITIWYDGRRFAGFARQPDRRTVEGRLWEVLREPVPDLRRIVVGGRTDRGVHALGQVISFRTRTEVSAGAIAASVDRAAPGEIGCLEARRTVPGFHAQFWARARHYTYLWPRIGPHPPADRLDRALGHLVGRHDFHAYARDTPKGKSTERRLLTARARDVRIDGRDFVRFDFSGESFLRHQVRVMVATALHEADAGPTRLLELLRSKDRTTTARPADPQHLYLSKIVY